VRQLSSHVYYFFALLPDRRPSHITKSLCHFTSLVLSPHALQPTQELILSLDIAFLLRYSHSSFSCRFLLAPLSALVAGPQFGVGFGWYRTSFTLEDCVTVKGCEVKLASMLGSFCSRIRAGEFGGIFSIFTGWVLTQER